MKEEEVEEKPLIFQQVGPLQAARPCDLGDNEADGGGEKHQDSILHTFHPGQLSSPAPQPASVSDILRRCPFDAV